MIGTHEETLEDKISSQSARIAVLGLGYIGLPIAVECAKSGYMVVGVDTNGQVIDILHGRQSHIPGVTDATLDGLIRQGVLRIYHVKQRYLRTESATITEIAACDVFIICVPTPLKGIRNYEPDIAFIEKATEIIDTSIGHNRSKQSRLVIVESTTYPGCTEETLLASLSQRHPNTNLQLAYSPERVSPGSSHELRSIPRILGAHDDASLANAKALYSQVLRQKVVPTDGISTAETIKCAENGLRLVSICYANRLAQLGRLVPKLSMWTAIAEAANKGIPLVDMFADTLLLDDNVCDSDLVEKAWDSAFAADSRAYAGSESIESVTRKIIDELRQMDEPPRLLRRLF